MFFNGSLRVKLILAPLGMLKRFWSLMYSYRVFVIETSTPTLNVHQEREY